jgi:hypothetical protein
MRELTEAEARLIRAMLGAPREGERELLRASQLPRSTYHAVRRRAYQEGWLKLRFIPDPLRFGFGAVTFAVAHPFAESALALMEKWSQRPEDVVLWGSTQLVFGVFFHRNPAEAQGLVKELIEPPMRPRSFLLSTELRPDSVPVYFDFEGLWSHLTRVPGPSLYPRSLVPVRPGASPVAVSNSSVRAALTLVLRPIVADYEQRTVPTGGLLGLPRPQRRLLEDGWVTRRVLLDVARLPSYRDRVADQIVFLHGDFLPGATSAALLRALTEQCHVFPILAAQDGHTALVIAIGQSRPFAAEDGASAAEAGRLPVLATVKQYLERIEVDSEGVQNLVPVVDHRYDRLLSRGERNPVSSS